MTLPSASVPKVTLPAAPGSASPNASSPASTPRSNGTSSPDDVVRAAPSRIPKPLRWTRRRKLLAGAGGGLLLVVLAVTLFLVQKSAGHVRADLVTHTVRFERLALTILERGSLESASNADVFCRVKAGAKNSTVATTIKWVIDDGSLVKKGDLLVDLDDSGLQEELKTQKITLETNQGNKIQAEEAYKIQVAQNDSDIKAAEMDLVLAKIDLEKYQKGDFPQALKDVEGRISSAESDVEMQRDRAAWAMRMLKKGYYTVSQAQAEQSKLDGYELALKKVLEEKRVLVDPDYGLRKRTEAGFISTLALKERTLNQVKAQALAKEVQSRTDRDTKKSIYLQSLDQYNDTVAEIKKCKIYAPQDGMVVYFIPDQARFGGGSQQSIVAQGEPVREGQKLMQIPDLRHMLVNTKVHEALVARVHPGQPGVIRVDSFPDRVLHGKVDSVAMLSSQQDWLSADVKVYATKVAIDDYLDGLKPGMSAEVTVTVGQELDHVLTVPVEAIIGSAELGKHRKCFVVTPRGPVERDIVIGMSNERMAEVREGLKEGDQVVLNPKVLVGDSLKTRQPGGQDRQRKADDGKAPKRSDKMRPPRPDLQSPPADSAGSGEKVGAGSSQVPARAKSGG